MLIGYNLQTNFKFKVREHVQEVQDSTNGVDNVVGRHLKLEMYVCIYCQSSRDFHIRCIWTLMTQTPPLSSWRVNDHMIFWILSGGRVLYFFVFYVENPYQL